MISFTVKFSPDISHEMGDQSITLVSPKGTRLTLRNQRVLFQVRDSVLVVTTHRKWRGFLKALQGTWTSLIRRLEQDKVWTYKVTALFKHFPITMRCGDGVVMVQNFLGVKTPLTVDVRGVDVQLKDPRTVLIHCRDRVLAGNVADRFYALRYRIHLKNMDRRVFTDGFLVQLV